MTEKKTSLNTENGNGGAAEVAATVRSWSDFARRNYREAERLAKAGR